MADFQHPFQCLQYVKRRLAGLPDVLIASAGRHIYSYAASSGQRLDIWPHNVDASTHHQSYESAADADSASEGQGPPGKRRKLSPTSPSQTETKTIGKDATKEPLPTTWLSVPILVTSSNGRHVIALTAEDKCVRVLRLEEDGTLQQLSARTMPKRPSALALTPDGNTLLCGDKFGDVYSIPLIPGEEYVKTRPEAKPYQPVATALTVHTKRNLESLEQQLRQAEKSKSAEEKAALNFEHQVILGHVSLLTDLISVTLPADPSLSRARSYILTADRDEHIRVSRGFPQAHIIEQYCLGHTSFISKLCVPSWAPEVLISGGGDNYLLLWNWVEGKVLQKIPLANSSEMPEVAVRGIWEVPLVQTADMTSSVKIILVGLEGSSQLLCYTLENDSTLKLQDTVSLSGNVLDLVGIDSRGSIIVSVDTVREPGSMHTWKSNPKLPQTLLECFRVNPALSSLKWIPSEDLMAVSINSEGTSSLSAALDEKQKKEIDDSLYSMGNLRKKRGDE